MGNNKDHGPATPEDLAMTLILGAQTARSDPVCAEYRRQPCCCEAIEALHSGIQSKDLLIKWPNDIMLKGAKAGGILIENSWRGNSWSSAAIGIGLNLAGTPPFPNATRLHTRRPIISRGRCTHCARPS